MSDRITYFETGIADKRAAKRYLRDKFRTSPLEPVATRPGARFYVTVRSGGRVGWLLGPYASHCVALTHVRRAKALACEVDRLADIYAYGTASRPDTIATVFPRDAQPKPREIERPKKKRAARKL